MCDERSWFKLSVKDGLLFEDVSLTLSAAVGPFALELEDDGCVWDREASSTRSCRITVCIPQVPKPFTLCLFGLVIFLP